MSEESVHDAGAAGEADPYPPLVSLLPRRVFDGRPDGLSDPAVLEVDRALRTTLDALDQPIGVYAAVRTGDGRIEDFRVKYVNDAACASIGIPRARQLGGSLLQLLPAHEEMGLLAHYRRVVEERTPFRTDALEYEDGGSEGPPDGVYAIQAIPWGDGFLATWRQRSDLASRLPPGEARLLEIVTRKAPVVLFVLDRKGVFHLSEGSGLDELGLAPGEVVGRSVFDLYADHPDILRAVERALEGETVQVTHRVGDATFDTKYTPLADEGSDVVEGVVGLATDITERAAAEAYAESRDTFFQALIENSAEVYAILDRDGVIRYQSTNVRAILGREPEELVGTEIFDHLHPEDAGGAREHFAELVRVEGAREPVRFRFEHADGGWRRVMGECRNLLHHPVIQGVVLNYQDVTEIEERKEKLRAMERMQALGRLAGGVAHDFNNLLTVLRGNLQLLLEEEAPGSPEHAMHLEMDAVVNRAAALTRQLLTFSSGRVSESPEVSDVGEVVHRNEKLLRTLLGSNVELDIRVGPGLLVEVDATRLEQIVLNLAVNARDAMPSGGRFGVRARRVALDEAYPGSHERILPGDYVQLVVSDTGTGIPKEIQDQVFEPFFTTKEEGEGTGLGLATIWGIVNEAGGTIHLYSEEGRGTAFRLYLPRSEGTGVSASTGEGEAERTVPAGAVASGTVLIADDDAPVRSVLRRALARLDVEIIEARDGQEALELARGAVREGRTIDLVLTDVMMPGLTGPELVGRLREELSPDLPAIFSSGYAAQQVREREGDLEHAEILEKPFEIPALIRTVSAALASRAEPGRDGGRGGTPEGKAPSTEG